VVEAFKDRETIIAVSLDIIFDCNIIAMGLNHPQIMGVSLDIMGKIWPINGI